MLFCFVLEDQPLAVLSFQKLKRGSLRGEETGSGENMAIVIVGADQ